MSKKSKIIRPRRSRIPDIKAFRALWQLLGKLHIKGCYYIIQETEYTWDDNGMCTGSYTVDVEYYHMGLADAKALVERIWDYQPDLPGN